MHLYIEQNIDTTETVDSAVIKKLYDLAVGGLDDTSHLSGSLKTTVTSAKYKTYLEGLFPGSLYIEADQYTLSFEDAEVENICVTNWGSSGGVTLNQLQAVTNPGAAFRNNTNITKFNEFQYFTGLINPASTTNQLFSGCTNLEEITLPPNLTMLSQNMFTNCTSLENITIPASVNRILSPFIGCTALKSVVATGLTQECNLGRQVNSLTTWEVNEGCTSMSVDGAAITSMNIPASVKYITFRNCQSLTTITFAQNSSFVGFSDHGSMQGCSALTTINNFPSTYTTISTAAFSGCSSLRTMIPLPTGCTSVPGSCYMDCRSMEGEFIIPATVTSIGEYAFRGTNSFTGIKIYATTPPTINVIQFGNLFSNASSNNNPAVGYPLYVPQSALATYQADANWSKFGSRLQGFTP